MACSTMFNTKEFIDNYIKILELLGFESSHVEVDKSYFGFSNRKIK